MYKNITKVEQLTCLNMCCSLVTAKLTTAKKNGKKALGKLSR